MVFIFILQLPAKTNTTRRHVRLLIVNSNKLIRTPVNRRGRAALERPKAFWRLQVRPKLWTLSMFTPNMYRYPPARCSEASFPHLPILDKLCTESPVAYLATKELLHVGFWLECNITNTPEKRTDCGQFLW